MAVLLVLLLLLTAGTGALFHSTQEIQSVAHYHTGNQALFSAEAGLLHALNAMNRMGVVSFQTDVANRWSEVFGASLKSIPGYTQLQYEVTVAADPAFPTDRGTVTAIGLAPRNARRVLLAVVQKGSSASGQGAIYLAADSVQSQFTGNAFDVDGNDHDQFGNLVPGGPVLPGIATRNDGVTNSVKGSLSDQQKDNVKGLGFTPDPLNPSVLTTGGPSVADLDRIVENILSNHPDVVYDNRSSINGNVTFGTVQNPQITYLTADEVKIKANGNASGAGILIVDGSITINGNLDFVGWIIVRGETVINGPNSADETTVLGNATILGSLWTGDLDIKVGGSAIVNFCEFCINLADQTGSGSMSNVPKPVQVVSWQEVL
ncbi:MAG: hypothetical protein KatS3mg076_0246 [Candidatus Binatia bacterium]|nr:MAG: hypothetical protein KatS3mg076_0246 [Candidatus Binatia bacterium]